MNTIKITRTGVRAGSTCWGQGHPTFEIFTTASSDYNYAFVKLQVFKKKFKKKKKIKFTKTPFFC